MATSDSPITCSQLARSSDEQLLGTASWARAWLLVENRDPWPSHAVNDGVPAELRQQIAGAGWNAQFVREFDDRARTSPWRVWFADAAKRAAWMWHADSQEHQLQLITDLLSGNPQPGEQVSDPFLLVCTNGKRDACCAVSGRAILETVLAGSEHAARSPIALESTHLGGHRFAGVVVSLPQSYQYRCDDGAHALRILNDARHGLVHSTGLRGHTARQAPEQIAEIAVREQLGMWQPDADITMECDIDGDTAQVRGQVAGRNFHASLTATIGTPRPESCGGDPKPLRTWSIAGVDIS